jgi:N-acetylglucosamine-6-phosphate deacetylase
LASINLVGGDIYKPDEIIRGGSVVVREDRITAVLRGNPPEDGNAQTIDVSGLAVLPGLIDLHIHGLAGLDLMADQADDVASGLPHYGVTSFLATTVAAPLQNTIEALQRIGDARRRQTAGARILGAHLEGPFLSPYRPGAMDPTCFRPPQLVELRQLLEADEGLVKLVTLAPEEGDALERIEELHHRGVVAALGHTAATFDQVLEAVKRGLSYSAHTFNAMGQMHQREPGAVGAVLCTDRITAEVIADGYHVHPAVIEVLVKTKGTDRIVVVSDAAPIAGLPPGRYRWLGRWIESDGLCARGEDGRLAGSVSLLNRGLETLVKQVGLRLSVASRLASLVPARVLGLEQSLGRLGPGWQADVAVFDESFRCRCCLVRGEVEHLDL